MLEEKVKKIRYGGPVEFSIEIALEKIEGLLKKDYRISKRAIGLLLLQEDEEIQNLVKEGEPDVFREIASIVARTKTHYGHPLDYVITMRRQKEINQIVKRVIGPLKEKKISFGEKLSRIMMNPITGIPILLIVIYFGLYQIVGVFAAQTIVDFLEITLFEERISPLVRAVFVNFIPYPLIQDLFVGEYGIFTQAIPYAVALILPIVAAFSLVFSIIEDTGYLPRLAMLIDRVFKKIGLSGRAVIPMTLGFGCDTMAVMVTRTLETIKEKIISNLLLALAVPCSAQLGIIFALLSGRPKALLIWGGVVVLQFLFIGYLASKVIPGRRPSFFMEVPPLRMPQLSNVLTKTYTRVQWYFMEVFPLFVLASILIWLGRLTGLFQLAIKILEPLVRLIGLPDETAVAFLFGFFRRDYGAAGLLDMSREGIFSGVQLVVAAVTLTLFIPCIAQFIMMAKERGIKSAAAIGLFILPFAFLVGFLVNQILTALGMQL